MTQPRAGVLTRMARELLTAARAGGVHRRDLRNGARVTVALIDGQVVMTFSRPDRPLGDVEPDTFVSHCEVPDGATRRPATGQRTAQDGPRTRHMVSYVWPDNARLEL